MNWHEAVQQILSNPAYEKLAYECYFSRENLITADRYYKSGEWNEVRKMIGLGRGRVALDLGAGSGISSYALARDGWNVYSLEPDPSDLVGHSAIESLVDSTGLQITVMKEFAENTLITNESIDLVFARQVMHHANDLSSFCLEANRVLKLGGSFLTIRDHVVNSEQDKQIFLANHPLHSYYGGENAFTLQQYQGALKAAGFAKTKTIGHYESDINLFPNSQQEIIDKITHRSLLLGRVLSKSNLRNIFFRSMRSFRYFPGNLYTFLSTK